MRLDVWYLFICIMSIGSLSQLLNEMVRKSPNSNVTSTQGRVWLWMTLQRSFVVTFTTQTPLTYKKRLGDLINIMYSLICNPLHLTANETKYPQLCAYHVVSQERNWGQVFQWRHLFQFIIIYLASRKKSINRTVLCTNFTLLNEITYWSTLAQL